MKGLIEFFVSRNQATFLIIAAVVFLGIKFYSELPKEGNPDVVVPIVLVSTELRGISSEDSERLLIVPIEEELRSIEGLKDIESVASEGFGYTLLHFVAGFDIEKAVDSVRSKVDSILTSLPEGASRPKVSEINLGLFPILSVVLSGDIDGGVLLEIAQNIRKRVESIPSVLSASITNDRKRVVEVILDPAALQAYDLNVGQLVQILEGNNVLLPSGNFDFGHSVRLDGSLKSVEDVMNLPVKGDGSSVIVVKDVADVRLALEDRKGYSRFNGKNSVTIDLSKRIGENIVDTTLKIRESIGSIVKYLPDNLKIDYIFDQSVNINNLVSDLENSVVFATLLVIVIIMFSINLRSALIIAFSIPCVFLLCFIGLWAMDVSINVVVLFSLIVAVGMLVDNAIVINEYADRKMIAGISPKESYKSAALDMMWPIIASTFTTMVVFLPLLFWPGVVGEFMKYLPITLVWILFGSLVVSLIFVPVIGGVFGKPSATDPKKVAEIEAIDSGDVSKMSSVLKMYHRALCWVIDNSKRFIFIKLGILIVSCSLFYLFGKGITFFPHTEPDRALIEISSKGNIGVKEKDKLVKTVEDLILDVDGISGVYAVSGSFRGGASGRTYTIGKINLEFKDWRFRRKAKDILREIRERISSVPGIAIRIEEEKKGPSSGPPISIQLSSIKFEDALALADKMLAMIESSNCFFNLDANISSTEMEWELNFDNKKASWLGVDLRTVSHYVNMLTRGLVATQYRASGYEDEMDVLVRFRKDERNLEQLNRLFVDSVHGVKVPLSQLLSVVPKEKVIKIERAGGSRIITIKADLLPGVSVDSQLKKLQGFLKDNAELAESVNISFKGEVEDRGETKAFLLDAFIFSIIGIMTVLMLEFNSIYQTSVVMSAIFFSITGVIIGLLVSNQAFGLVMCGVGIITLAGVVVNNNILLIDAFQSNIASGMNIKESIIRTAISRFRPIVLTSGTTVIGLLPMMLGLNIDFLGLEITYDAPASQLWRQLSTTIAGGLSFATVLTLFFTPALLSIRYKDYN